MIIAQVFNGLEDGVFNHLVWSCIHTSEVELRSRNLVIMKLSFLLQQGRGYLIGFVGKAKGERDSGLLALQ